jgi:hypothetical protein
VRGSLKSVDKDKDRKDELDMNSVRAINRKARKVEEIAVAERGDLRALQTVQPKGPGKVYHPMGCTLNFTPGWEVDISGGTAGLCQPIERDLFDCYLGCGWPAQVPDHLNNAPDWTDKCASAVNDWRKVDIVFP